MKVFTPYWTEVLQMMVPYWATCVWWIMKIPAGIEIVRILVALRIQKF
jgi:hypothetical protein